MKIPILDLKKQYRALKKRIRPAVFAMLEGQSFILGDEVEKAEKNIAQYCGVKYAIGVNSGTDALILALDVMGVGEGDEVITTSFTFVATAEAIVRVRARPVFADIDAVTYNINPALIEKKITKKTKVIIPVHLYGLTADMDAILKISRKHRLRVLEDCAQSIGSEYKGKKAGSMSDAAALSFYPGKNLGCFGDGGMVITNDRKIRDRIRLLRNHGSQKKYEHGIVGYNSRLDNLQAAVLNIKLPYLDSWIERRIENAAFFSEGLKETPLVRPDTPKGHKHSFYLYVLRTENAGEMIDYLTANGIEARSNYPMPLHLQKCFGFLGYKRGDFPESEKLSRENFTIPTYPELSEAQKRYIVKKIKAFFDR